MKRLVESWTEAEKRRGNNLAAALRRLNDTLGMRVTHSRLAEWRRGVYVPSPVVLSFMFHDTLPWALEEAGISFSQEQLEVLYEIFWVRRTRRGETVEELL